MTAGADYLKSEIFDKITLNNNFEDWEESSIRNLATALELSYQEWGATKSITKSDIVEAAMGTELTIDSDQDGNANETLTLEGILVAINTYLQQEWTTWKVEIKPEYFTESWDLQPEVPAYVQSIANNEQWVQDIALLIQAFGSIMLDNDVERGYGSYLEADLDDNTKTEVALDSIFGAQTLHIAQKALNAVAHIKKDDATEETVTWIAALDKEWVSFDSYNTSIKQQLDALKQQTLQENVTPSLDGEVEGTTSYISHISELPSDQHYEGNMIYSLTIGDTTVILTHFGWSIQKPGTIDFIDFSSWKKGHPNDSLLLTYHDGTCESVSESWWSLVINQVPQDSDAETVTMGEYYTAIEIKELLPNLKLACGEGIQKVEIEDDGYLSLTLSPYEWKNPSHSTQYTYRYKIKKTSEWPVVEFEDPNQDSLVSYSSYDKRLHLSMSNTYSRQESVTRFLQSLQSSVWLSISTFIAGDDPQYDLISYRSGRQYTNTDSATYGKRFWIDAIQNESNHISFQFDYHGPNTRWHYQKFSLDYRDFNNLWVWSDWFWDIFKVKMAAQIKLAAVSEAAAWVTTTHSDQADRKKDIVNNPWKYLGFTQTHKVKDYIIDWPNFASIS